MSQFSFGNIDEATTDGFDLADMLEKFEAAVNSMHAGDTAPTYKITGMPWRDTSGTPHVIKMWTGGVWLPVLAFNTATGIITPYFQGALQTVISTLNIGQGLENSSGSLRIKLRDGSLLRDNNGIGLPDSGVGAGVYNNPKLTINSQGIITLAEPGVSAVAAVTPGGNYIAIAGGQTQVSSTSKSTGANRLSARTYVKRAGTVRIGFTLQAYNFTYAGAYGRLYLNGEVIYGTSLSGVNSSGRSSAFYFDQAVVPGDIIDWYVQGYCSNFNTTGLITGGMSDKYIGIAEADVPAWPIGDYPATWTAPSSGG